MLPRIRQHWPAVPSPQLSAAILLLAAGAALRLYALGNLPPGLNVDEASAAYESWALLQSGIDSNGHSWPLYFLWWGSGQAALYSYLAIPFIWLGGLTEFAYRLPMALSAILSLFLLWLIGRRAVSPGFALLLLLLTAFSVWHLMATRWALEGNLLPCILLLSVYFLSRSDRARLLIQAAAVFVLSLSVYAYPTAYALAPLFLTLIFLWLRLNRLADWRRLLLLSALAFVTTFPIIVLVFINTFDLETVKVLGFTIPRYTGPPRYTEISLLFGAAQRGFFANIGELAALLLGRRDGVFRNAMPGFGALPPFGILLSLLALGVVLYRAKTRQDYGIHLLVACWFLAALLLALLVEVNINRINALWLPAIYLMGLGAWFLYQRRRALLYLLTAAYVAYSGLFLYQYFRNYADYVNSGVVLDFHYGLGPAIQRAVAAAGDDVIYLSNFHLFPWPFALFYAQIPPQEHLAQRILARPNDPFYLPLSTGQFIFVSPLSSKAADNLDPFLQQRGGERLAQVTRDALADQGIDLSRVAHYVLRRGELPSLDRAGLVLEQYGNYYYAYDPAVAAAGALKAPLLRVDRPPVTEPPAAVGPFRVYLENNALTYYKESCDAYDTRHRFFLHIRPRRAADLPPDRQRHGFANRDFDFGDYGALYGPNCWAKVPLPDYPIATIRTGQLSRAGDILWQADFPAHP